MSYFADIEINEPTEAMGEWIRIQSTMCLMEYCIDQMKSAIANKKIKKLSHTMDKILSILSKQEYHLRNIKSEKF